MAWSNNLVAGSPTFEIVSSENQRIRVVAGPGTGKSFAMKRRVARLLEGGVDPSKILAVTFTRVAAEDLHRELVGMGIVGCEELRGTTLHSLGMQILVRNHVLIATGRTPRPLNDFEIKPLEADLAEAHGGVKEVRKKIKAYDAAWARLQHDQPGYVQAQEDQDFEYDLLPWLKFHRAMLIGEVIPQLYAYLSANPAAEERTEFVHVLVDEYQDLNKAEQSVISFLSDQAAICIVGDDDQSIYSFKHAHPEGILEWLQQWPDADDVALDNCRRCPTLIVEIANSLIARNIHRPTRRILTPRIENGRGVVQILQYINVDEEILGVTQQIVAMIGNGVPPGDILVLAQRSIIGTPIYERLVASGIPAKSYYAEAELDDEDAQRKFSVLKLFVDRNDHVALRWLLGLGSATWLKGGYRRLRDFCEANAVSPWDALVQLESGVIRIPHTKDINERFVEIKSVLLQLEDVFDVGGLALVVDQIFPDGDARVRDIRALALKVIEAAEGRSRASFLRELTSLVTRPEVPTEITEVRIMSLHKSKGLSSPVTFIAGCIEGLLPRQPEASLSRLEQEASLEEQRRLFFVGITRVKSAPNEGKLGTLVLT